MEQPFLFWTDLDCLIGSIAFTFLKTGQIWRKQLNWITAIFLLAV